MTASPETASDSGQPDPWAVATAVPIPRKELRALQKRSDGPAFRWMIGHLSLLAGTSALIWWTLPSWWAIIPMFLQGSLIVFLFAPLHECSHGTAFKTRRLNTAVAMTCGFVMMRPALYFRYRHAAHHSYTQDPQRDPDQVPFPETVRGYLGEVLGMRFWPKMIGTLYRGCTGRYNDREKFFLPENERGRVSAEVRVYVALYAAIAALTILTGTWQIPLMYWLIPRFIGEPVLRTFRIAEHTGMEEGPNLLSNTRTTLTNPAIRFVYWNMPFHAEHHLAPSVPFHRLADMHETLPADSLQPARGYLRVHRDLIRRVRTGDTRYDPAAAA
ncbi:fatty acid desaturase [Mycobacterium sp. 21AC1]|uniref:fatty acid desaturase n=1 Tax=[Mycobacterium] appelbergii TaxID=2939269 RepID=UPI002939414F|nr:fatty acid desaturase [Mycobacterium sp. 21AC1]MDV3126988.1 fatty acid desaturase [Mycobacterium sp. 21AC1]